MTCDDCTMLRAELADARATISHLKAMIDRYRSSRREQEELRTQIRGQLDKSHVALSNAKSILLASAGHRDEARRLLAEVEQRLISSDNKNTDS